MINLDLRNISVDDFAEITKKMTFDMIKSFALILQDFNPIHLNEEYAANSRFKKRIIPGMLVGSLFSGLFGTNLPGEGCIYKSQNLRFKRAIYIGDVVKAKVEVTHDCIKKKVITFTTRCFVHKKIMIDVESEVFVP